MTEYAPGAIAEAFNSMLRTDYISLNDIGNLLITYALFMFGIQQQFYTDFSFHDENKLNWLNF